MKIILFVILYLMSSFTHSHDEITNRIDIERLQYQNKTTNLKFLSIKNLYGNIRIRGSKQDNITYHAVSQYSDLHKAKLIVSEVEGSLSLEIQYASPPLKESLERVDVAIILPGHLKLDIEIEKGNLTTKNISNETKATSKNSNLSVKTSNTANLFTKNGDIELTLIPHKQQHKTLLKTHAGDVRVNYNFKQTPIIKVISGGVTTSNSNNLLSSKSIKNRETNYKPSVTFGEVSIQTDTGNIQLIEIEQL